MTQRSTISKFALPSALCALAMTLPAAARAEHTACRAVPNAVVITTPHWVVRIMGGGIDEYGNAPSRPTITVKGVSQYFDRPGITLGHDQFATPRGREVARNLLSAACDISAGPDFAWLRRNQPQP